MLFKSKATNNNNNVFTAAAASSITYSSITAADYVDKIKGFFDGFCFNFSGFDSLRAKGVLSK